MKWEHSVGKRYRKAPEHGISWSLVKEVQETQERWFLWWESCQFWSRMWFIHVILLLLHLLHWISLAAVLSCLETSVPQSAQKLGQNLLLAQCWYWVQFCTREFNSSRQTGRRCQLQKLLSTSFSNLSDWCLQIIQYYVTNVSSLYWHLCFSLLGQHRRIF